MPGQYVDNAWQKYRRAPPEHHCCAKPREPIIRFPARIETNARGANLREIDPIRPYWPAQAGACAVTPNMLQLPRAYRPWVFFRPRVSAVAESL